MIKKLVQVLFLPTLIFGGMYLAKLFEIIFANVSPVIMFLIFLVIIYKIIEEVI